MSLNRCEQRVYDYLQHQPEERQFWISKVQTVWQRSGDDPAAIAQLEPELWLYYKERAVVVPSFKESASLEGLQRTSMKNLAELLLRIWVEPRPKKKPEHSEGAGTI